MPFEEGSKGVKGETLRFIASLNNVVPLKLKSFFVF